MVLATEDTGIQSEIFSCEIKEWILSAKARIPQGVPLYAGDEREAVEVLASSSLDAVAPLGAL